MNSFKSYLVSQEKNFIDYGESLKKAVSNLDWDDLVCEQSFESLKKLIKQVNEVIREINININILEHQIKAVEEYLNVRI